MINILNNTVKCSIYALVFLLPLFFLPFSLEVFEFNKQYLLFFLVFLAFLAWLGKMVFIDKEVKVKYSPLDIFILAFLLIAVLSAIFSVDSFSSLTGSYFRFSNGLIDLLVLVILFFLITNNSGLKIKNQGLKNKNEEENLKSEEEKIEQPVSVGGLIKLFLGSVAVVVLFSYFSIFGIWGKLSQFISLPRGMTQLIFNPVSGSLEGLAIFLSFIVVLFTGLILSGQKEIQNKIARIGFYVLFLAILVLLVIINFNPAWLIIFLSLILFLIFALWTRVFREDINKLILPIIFIGLSFSFLFVAWPEPQLREVNGSVSQEWSLGTRLPKELVLDQQTSWSIGIKSATENIKSGLFGSGIGTFSYGFAKFKPSEINRTDFWQTRFDRSGSHLAEILATMGFFGFLSYLVFIGVFLLISFILLKQSRKELGLFLGVLALFLGQLFFYQNAVLAFSFWLFLGLSIAGWQSPLKEKTFSFKGFPELSLVFSVLFTVVFLAFIVVSFFGIRFYLAEVNYKNYFETMEGDSLKRAASLNPFQSRYKMVMARYYLNEAINEVQKPVGQMREESLINNVYSAINFAKEATELSPNKVATWHTLGMIYQQIQGLAAGANKWGIISFERALELEPNNPTLYTELGKFYFFEGENDKAKELFATAKELRPEYAEASVYLALSREVEDDIEGAIRIMEETISFYPYNIDAIFQLGRFYLNNNQIDEAITQLEWAVRIFPGHSNSLYSLGVAYQRKGNKEKAIEYFEKVLEINPGNDHVIQKIQELKVVERDDDMEEDMDEDVEEDEDYFEEIDRLDELNDLEESDNFREE